jgi:hypothetical protein
VFLPTAKLLLSGMSVIVVGLLTALAENVTATSPLVVATVPPSGPIVAAACSAELHVFVASPGHVSQTSPKASPSVLIWSGFNTVGQLSA